MDVDAPGPYNFFVSKPKVHHFLFNARGIVVDNAVYHLSTAPSVSRSNSKVVLNLVEFWTFLPCQILKGWCSPKVVSASSPLPSGTSRGKVSWGWSP